jgi:hypothetical protein
MHEMIMTYNSDSKYSIYTGPKPLLVVVWLLLGDFEATFIAEQPAVESSWQLFLETYKDVDFSSI